jgi:DNA-binding MarR family transcriptional regulator
MGFIGRIARLAHFFSREMYKTFAQHGLNSAKFDVLATLRRSGPPYGLSPGDLLTATMVTSGTMTNRIDQLEKAGLVERIQNPDDKRGFIISLTDKGFAVIDKVLNEHVETQARLVASLSSEERESANALLRTFLMGIESDANG